MSDTDLLERPPTKAPETAQERDGEPKGADISLTLLARQRAAVADLERLRDEVLALLDDIAGEPDLEDDGSEEWSLGSLSGCQLNWADGAGFDLEEEHDGREPSLGSLGGTAESGPWHNQEKWARGGGSDLEDEHDGREPPEDDEYTLGRSENVVQGYESPSDDKEPSLGSVGAYSAAFDQSYWADSDPSGLALDAEEQCEDEGGACEDENDPWSDAPAPDGERFFMEEGKRVWPPAGTALGDKPGQR